MRSVLVLCGVIDPGSRTEPCGVTEGPDGKWARVALRGLELEYFEPAPGSAAAAATLAERGAGITTAVFGVDDPDSWGDRPLATTPELGFDIAIEVMPSA